MVPAPSGFEPYEVAVLDATTGFYGLAAADGRVYIAGPIAVAVYSVDEAGKRDPSEATTDATGGSLRGLN